MGNDCVDIYYNGCCKKESAYEQSEIDDNNHYLIIEDHTPECPQSTETDIEKEKYFRAVDRSGAEEILSNRVDGSCLVRPYKEKDNRIKYIASVYAQNNFFHLHIRLMNDHHNKYAIGLKKPFEKQFNTPKDIIKYYQLNKLLCTNRNISLSLVLFPIS